MLRRSKSALTSRARASDISATTRKRLVDKCVPAMRREAFCSPDCKSLRAMWRAGTVPAITPIMVTSRDANRNAAKSKEMALRRGNSEGLTATMTRNPAMAAAIPSPPPSNVRSMLSVTSWRTIRRLDAPNAPRTANSPVRCAPRANKRLMTLTHAMANTMITSG